MQFDSPPHVPLWRTVFKRTRTAGIPRIEASAAQLPPGDLAGYRTVCGFPDLDTLPPCFPDLLCRGLQLAVLTAPAFPVGLLGIVHVRQQITQDRAIRASEALSGRVWVEGSRAGRRGGEFDLHTLISAGADDVWHGVTTILSRDLPRLPSAGTERGARMTENADPRAEHTATWTLPADLGRRYARVSGDVNPIHQYGWMARLFGFEGAIIHGWWTLARCLAELEAARVPPNGRLTVEARFLAPLFLPSTPIFSSTSGPLGQTFFVRDGGRLALQGTLT